MVANVDCDDGVMGEMPGQRIEDRRSVLEGIIDLRMMYYAGDLTIEGKVPVPSDAGKKWNSGISGGAHCMIGTPSFARCSGRR